MTNNSQYIIDCIHESTAKKGPSGLDRMKRLLELLGNPEKKLQIFHVAGTNGKGSVSNYLSAVLQEAGYHVGVFTSPHVMVYNERFVIDSKMISDNDFVRYGTSVLTYNEWLNQEGYGYLSEFEILTAIAYLFFAGREVDYAIMEVGLGGIIDSTNTIQNPVSTIITQIGKDHTAFLGDTLKEIAWNKAGIIKPGVPVISESPEKDVRDVISWTANRKEAPFVDASSCAATVKALYPIPIFDATVCGTEFRDLRISMSGQHQIRNAIAALAALLTAKQEGKVALTEEQIRTGLESAKIMGRFEFLQEDNPTIIIDGGHNPAGIRTAIAALKDFLKYDKTTRSEAYESLAANVSGQKEDNETDLENAGTDNESVNLPDSNLSQTSLTKKLQVQSNFEYNRENRVLIVFGCFKDKEYDEMLEELLNVPVGTHFIITEPHSERALSCSVLQEQLTQRGFYCDAIADEKEAYETAVNGCYDVILFVGSIYLIGDIRILYQTKGW